MSLNYAKVTAARAFVRSLNILLKFARLYSFDHTRTAEQFETAWAELQAAIAVSNESGLLLGAVGSRLLLDGAAVEAAPAERSFAQLLSAAGLASIQFTSAVRKEDLEHLIRAFPTQNTKPSVLAEQLKSALAGTSGIRINEIRFVAEDASMPESRLAARLTANTLGGDANSLKDWLRDPQKLLQLIAAAEGSRGGSGAPGAGPGGGGGSGSGTGTGVSGFRGDYGAGAGAGSTVGERGAGDAGGVGFAGGTAKDEDILNILRLLTHLQHSAAGEGEGMQPGPFQEELSKLPPESKEMLRQALAAIATQTPLTNSKDPMLLRLAEHLAIRFALARYERGEVKVNAVRQMLDRMCQEIEGLRKTLGAHEEKMAQAGIIVESHADMLDRQFWASVPENGKRTVLCSSDAWCIPSRNVKQYVEELLRRGDEKLALEILRNYASCVRSSEAEARRRTAIGLAELADQYASAAGGQALVPAIQAAGVQLSVEREESLQGLVSAAFVRLAQEAGARHSFQAMLQALDSLDSVEHQRPVFAQSLRPRIGLEKLVPELLEEAVRADLLPDGLSALLQRVPQATAEHMISRFNRIGNRVEMQRLVELAQVVGGDVAASLRDTLRTGSANEAAETVGLLSRLDPASLERWIPERLREWPRNAQDRTVRLLAMVGATERGSLLMNLLGMIDPVLLPLAIDEIGFSDDTNCTPGLIRLAEGDIPGTGGDFIRLKVVEALGRLKARPAVEMLRKIAETRNMLHWASHPELRLAAVQSLARIDPRWAKELLPRSGFSDADLTLTPLDSQPNAKYFRRRRYTRVRLSQPIPAIATAGQDSYRLEVRGLSLSGGIAAGEKHLQPGTLVSMKIGSGLRPIRAQVLMRDARAQGLGFEFADMDLDERARLRKLLLKNMAAPVSESQGVFAQTST
jgi:hypothetical protein